jgi:hypothetical protein
MAFGRFSGITTDILKVPILFANGGTNVAQLQMVQKGVLLFCVVLGARLAVP